MKAIVVREFGGPEVLRLEEVPAPVPGPGEVSIEVQFVGVNFTDVRNRWGDGLGKVPFTPGVEVAGTVRAVGPGADRFVPGTRVAAMTRGNAYAEVVNAREELTFDLPPALADAPAAAGMLVTVPLALNLLERAAAVKPGEVVLLHAASGGVGTVVGQLVQGMSDIRLYGTVGDLSKRDYVLSHGFLDVFSYADFDARMQEVTDGLGPDVVLDPIGGDVQARSLAVLAPFGRLVSFSNISRENQELPDAEWMRARCVGYVGLSNGYLANRSPHIYRESLERAVALVASGALRIDVSEVFPLAAAESAHRAFEQRRVVGKVVLEV